MHTDGQDGPKRRMSQAEYARYSGLSKQYVSRLVQEGRLSIRGGVIDPVIADQERRQRTRPRMPSLNKAQRLARQTPQQEEQPPSAVADYWTARAKKEASNAALAELRLKQERGELLEQVAVEDALFTMARMVRDRLTAVPDRLGLPRQQRLVVQREIQQALNEFCEDVDALLARVTVDDEEEPGAGLAQSPMGALTQR